MHAALADRRRAPKDDLITDLVRLQGRLRYRYFEGSDLFLVLQSDLSQAGRVNDLSVLVKMTLQWPS